MASLIGRTAAVLIGVLASGLPAAAQDLALLIGVRDYAALPRVSRAEDLAGRAGMFRDAGLTVIRVRGPEADDIDTALAAFEERVGDAERILVALSGRFVSSASETYLLPEEIRDLTPATVSDAGLPLSVVLAHLATRPGRAVLALATDDADFRTGAGLSPGPGDIRLPQGVTLLAGTPEGVAETIEEGLLRPGAALREAAEDVRLSGYLPEPFVFTPGAAGAPADDPGPDAEDAYWRATRNLDTRAAYESYLETYPSGRYERDARSAIARIEDAPIEAARRAEAEIGLSRAARQQIQRDLSLLDYDTRGIDGIFGPGTRGAIEAWQSDEGLAVTGYLDRPQIRRLAGMADARAVELEREAEVRREADAREDRRYWDETGRGAGEEGLRAYLERYPDGLFSEVAETRLAEIEAGKRETARRADRQAWDTAREADSVRSYRRYLEDQPEGAFREEARARIDALRGQVREDAASAEAAEIEEGLRLSTVTKRAIEGRLESLGYEPGRVDGEFDRDTRRAIRRYQRARELPETGYLNDATVVRILADSVRSIFE